MIQVLIPSLAALVAGLFVGGCAGGDGRLSKSLLERNAQLENQVATGQQVATGLAVMSIILACGLGASLYRNIRGGSRGKKQRKQSK